MKTEITRKLIMTEDERQAIRDLVNIIEDDFSIEIEDKPDLVTDIIVGIFCKNDLIHTSYGNIIVEYKKALDKKS